MLARACNGWASARAIASSPTSRTSPRRSSPSSRPRASARSGRRARRSSASRSVLDRLGPARAEGAAGGRRLPLRREARRPPRAGGRDPRGALAGLRDRRARSVRRRRRTTRSRTRSSWDELLAEPGPLEFDPLPFAHPLYVLFSSGTTGLPKAIVHGHGGILLEHLKNHGFSWDLRAGDRLQWFTTTAWMMWNALVSVLLHARVDRHDRRQPGVSRPLLPVAARSRRRGRRSSVSAPRSRWPAARRASSRDGCFDLSSVRMVCEAGSPLPLEGYEWLYEQFGPDVNVNVGSGGHGRVHGARAGLPAAARLRRRDVRAHASGVDADAFDPDGKPVVGELGELVIKQPMPSMPVGFWNDPDGSRYREAYFEHFPGVWRFGDWILFTERGSCDDHRPLGRDAQPRRRPPRHERALRGRRGARRGARQPRRPPRGEDELLLFVVLRPGIELDDELRNADRGRAAHVALAAARAGHDRRGAGDPAHAHREEARGARSSASSPAPRWRTSCRKDVLVDPGSIEPFAEYARSGRADDAPSSRPRARADGRPRRDRAFYRDALGFEPGHGRRCRSRALAVPGRHACLHVADRAAYEAHAASVGLAATGASIDHVAFAAEAYDDVAARLEAAGVDAVTNDVPDAGMTQIFLSDPNGVRIELNVT